MGEEWRCFVAIDPPAAVRAGVAAVQDRMRRMSPNADVRWTAPDAFHLTLGFLGAIAPEVAGTIGERLGACVAGLPRLRLAIGAAGAFPDRRRPRVLWIGVGGRDAAGLAACAARVRTEAVACGVVVGGEFAPHVTLGRVRRARGAAAIRRAIDDVAALAIDWDVERIVLYRSRPTSAGGRYEALAAAPFASN